MATTSSQQTLPENTTTDSLRLEKPLMQNGSYPWVPPIAQKGWNPSYQSSLANFFLKKPPVNFGTSITQLAVASRYVEKVSPGSEPPPRCLHPNAQDGTHPCNVCQQYINICSSFKASGESRPPDRPSATENSNSPEPKALVTAPTVPQPQTSPVPLTTAPKHCIKEPVKQFVCIVCHKLFTQKGNLKTHMMIHTGEKPYSCQVCGKSFTQKGNVDTHMKIHSGEKEFSCDSCGKKFTQKGNLKTHIRSLHTKEKPYACGICGKCFSQKGNMKTHVRTHNKEDRLPCTICGKTFSQKGNLKTHIQRHTGEIPSKRLYNPRATSELAAAALATINPNSRHNSHLPVPHIPNLPPSVPVSSSQNSPTIPKPVPRIPPSSMPPQAPTPVPETHVSSPSCVDLTFSEQSKGEKLRLTSPLPKVSTIPVSTNHSPTVHNPTPSPSHSQISSPPPANDMGMSHFYQEKHSQNSHIVNHYPETPHSHVHSPSEDQQDPNIVNPPPPLPSMSSHPSSSNSEIRPYYSAPSTPVSFPFPPPSSPQWFPYSHNRNSSNHPIAAQPNFSVNNIQTHPPTPLSRLSLFAARFGAPHLNNQHMDQIVTKHLSQGPVHDQYQPSGNPDFSQLLD